MADVTDERWITLGVDTHLDLNVAAALDEQGRLLGTKSVATTAAGHRELLTWAKSLGKISRVGVEGTGTFGAGLARYLATIGVAVVDVDRPDRRARRTRGKTDTVDAEIAARAVLAGTQRTTPKAATGRVESLRMLRMTRRSALKARTQAVNQIKALVVTAPDELRHQVEGLSLARFVDVASRWRPGDVSRPAAAAKMALRSLARRCHELTVEEEALNLEIARIVALTAPGLLALQNVGPDTAAALLVAAGDNPHRLRSESSFAHLCGVAPLAVSSGKSHRHRLNRGGNRDANSALYTIAFGRLYRDERTRAYVARRTAQGLSKREIMRCLKRFIAREVYRALLVAMPSVSSSASLC